MLCEIMPVQVIMKRNDNITCQDTTTSSIFCVLLTGYYFWDWKTSHQPRRKLFELWGATIVFTIAAWRLWERKVID